MLKTQGNKLLAKDLIYTGQGEAIDGVDSGSNGDRNKKVSGKNNQKSVKFKILV